MNLTESQIISYETHWQVRARVTHWVSGAAVSCSSSSVKGQGETVDKEDTDFPPTTWERIYLHAGRRKYSLLNLRMDS